MNFDLTLFLVLIKVPKSDTMLWSIGFSLNFECFEAVKYPWYCEFLKSGFVFGSLNILRLDGSGYSVHNELTYTDDVISRIRSTF